MHRVRNASSFPFPHLFPCRSVAQDASAKKKKYTAQMEEMRKMGQLEERRKRTTDVKRVDESRTAAKLEEQFEGNGVVFAEEIVTAMETTKKLRETLDAARSEAENVSETCGEIVGLVDKGGELAKVRRSDGWS